MNFGITPNFFTQLSRSEEVDSLSLAVLSSSLDSSLHSSCSGTLSESGAEWTLRNDWNDGSGASYILDNSNGIEAYHRQWGFGNYWLVYSIPFNLSAGEAYDVALDFKNNSGNLKAANITVAFSNQINWNGPNDLSNSTTLSGPFDSDAFQSLSTPLSVNSDGQYYLCVLVDFGTFQVTEASTVSLSNVEVCGLDNNNSITVNQLTREGVMIADVITYTEESYELFVYDLRGQILYQETGYGNQHFEFGESFESGLYVIQVISKSGTTSTKIIKE